MSYLPNSRNTIAILRDSSLRHLMERSCTRAALNKASALSICVINQGCQHLVIAVFRVKMAIGVFLTLSLSFSIHEYSCEDDRLDSGKCFRAVDWHRAWLPAFEGRDFWVLGVKCTSVRQTSRAFIFFSGVTFIYMATYKCSCTVKYVQLSRVGNIRFASILIMSLFVSYWMKRWRTILDDDMLLIRNRDDELDGSCYAN